jgi:hypothetical protein
MQRTRRPFLASSISLLAASALAVMLAGPAIAAATLDAATLDATTLDASGSDLGAPTESVVRTLAPTQGCQRLLDSGKGDCAVVHTATGDLVVTVEPGPKIGKVLASRPWTVQVFRPTDAVPDGWEVALSTHGERAYAGPLYAQVTATAADVTGDGHDELVLGYRSEGTGQILDLDVVGTDATGTPQLLAHDTVYKGNVRARNGHLVEYEPVYQETDANCCPTWVQRDDLEFRDGVFHLETIWKVPTKQAEIPPSDIG